MSKNVRLEVRHLSVLLFSRPNDTSLLMRRQGKCYLLLKRTGAELGNPLLHPKARRLKSLFICPLDPLPFGPRDCRYWILICHERTSAYPNKKRPRLTGSALR